MNVWYFDYERKGNRQSGGWNELVFRFVKFEQRPIRGSKGSQKDVSEKK